MLEACTIFHELGVAGATKKKHRKRIQGNPPQKYGDCITPEKG